MTTAAGRTVGIARVVLTLAVALLLGMTFADHVDAKTPANGVSIKTRVKNLREWCEDLGGSLETTKTVFGSTITKCHGGSDDGTKCVLTKKYTYCKTARPQPPSAGDDVTAPGGGMADPGDQPSGDGGHPGGGGQTGGGVAERP